MRFSTPQKIILAYLALVSPLLISATAAFAQVAVDVDRPSFLCNDCDTPAGPVTGGETVTFAPTVQDDTSGVERTRICADAVCGRVLCANETDVPPKVAAVRSCSIKTELCVTGQRAYWVEVTDVASNKFIGRGGGFITLLAGGCPCVTSTDCSTGTCLSGLCIGAITKPGLNTTALTLRTQLGALASAVIIARNPLPVPDTLELDLVGDPQKIGLWSWWSGHRFDAQKSQIELPLGAGENKSAIFEMLGGQILTGTLRVNARSKTTGLIESTTINVEIVPRPGELVTAPEFGWEIFVAMIAAAGLILNRRRFLKMPKI